MFRGAYHIGEDTFLHRPKYGALNIHHYLDGASPRFGSCYFSLNSNAIGGCTLLLATADQARKRWARGTRFTLFYVSLRSDIGSLYLDESFRHTDIHKQAEDLCGKYQIWLIWIPERSIKVSIGDEFRGPAIPVLAKRIESHFQLSDGLINAEIIGQASRFTSLHPDAWSDIGNEQELFQYLKQLWHTVAYSG